MCRRVRPWDDLSALSAHSFLSLWSSSRVIVLVRVHLTCSLLTFVMALVPATGSNQESAANSTKDIPDIMFQNLSATASVSLRVSSTDPPSGVDAAVQNGQIPDMSVEDDIPREYPTALVIASSVAAVSILVFFFLAYCWHTHQLDSRARKLAIRLAADAEQGAARRRSCLATQTRSHARAPSVSEPSPDLNNHYEALAMEDDLGQYSDCGRSSMGVSESEAGDSEDMFGLTHLPGIGERGRSLNRGVRGGHKKWNRSRKYSSGANMDKRDSAVTDKEILTHFASRRHSTFFI